MSKDKAQILRYAILLNLVIGLYNLWMYVIGDWWFNLLIGSLNIGVWVFNRDIGKKTLNKRKAH